MTEKRFNLRLSKLGNGMITDTQKKEELYFDKEFLDATLPKTNEWLNELADENELLKQQIGNLEHTRDFCAERCERLEKENEELKFEIRKVQMAYEQLWEHTYK